MPRVRRCALILSTAQALRVGGIVLTQRWRAGPQDPHSATRLVAVLGEGAPASAEQVLQVSGEPRQLQ